MALELSRPDADMIGETEGFAMWMTVADAARRAGVSSSTVRHWYRSGRLATQRRDGDHGAFLVRVDEVVRLADHADETKAELRRLAADLEDARAQIETAREQLRLARGEAATAGQAKAELEREVAFLRSQLLEANAEVRAAKGRVADLEAQVQEVRRAALFGSITSTNWVDEVDKGYRGPLRPQEPFAHPAAEDADDLLPRNAEKLIG